MAEQKKIQSVEILHLDETGYGPEGKHTRREWREECLTHLLAGKEQFEAWQRSWEAQAQSNENRVSFELTLNYDDGSLHTIGHHFLDTRPSHTLDFSGQAFEQHLSCNGLAFLTTAYFIASQFSHYMDFRESQFSADVNFRESQFLGFADFSESQFSGDADFRESQFSGYAYFSESQFSGDADFRESQFSGYADFSESQFSGDADFRESQFSGNADFSESQFSGDADFRESQFSGNAEFGQALFEAGSLFYETTFAAFTNFENASFANVGHFEQTWFETKIPAFRGCKIDATRLEFSDKKHFSPEDYSEDAIKNISFLKRLADQHGQVDQAIEFNAMELRAKKALTWEELFTKNAYGTFSFWIFTALYEKLSDYGRSFMRPLAWLMVIFAITWILVFNAASDYPQVTCDPHDQACIDKQPKFQLSAQRAATEYTLYRATGLIHFSDKGKELPAINERLFGQPIEPWQMRAWGLFMSFASTVLFFFIALGLRNHYRIK